MKPISSYTDPKQLLTIMENAKRIGRMEVYWEAFRRRCELLGKEARDLDPADPLHLDFAATLAAYEQLLSEKNNRTTIATRTRSKIQNKGVVQSLIEWALAKTPTTGFDLLMTNGMESLTGEALIIKYSDRFPPHVVEAAQSRIEKYRRGLS